MKKERKNVMKTIKILTIILLIVLVSMVGFFGIYKQNKNQVSNIVKDYTYAMDINGTRTIKLALNSENADEIKTEENYNKAKKIIEKRLKKLSVQEYNISLNKNTGEIIIEIPENSNTDNVVSSLTTVGKFEILDSETKEVLMNNDNIKSSSVLYNTTSSGTSVYLEIAFNKDGKQKLEEISKTYVKSENNTTTENETAENETTENNTAIEDETADNSTTESTSSTEKKITMNIDGQELMSTSFDEAITTGKIQLSVGNATTDTSTLKDYISQAQSVATVLDSGNLPITYDLVKNQYILSNITEQNLLYIAIAIAAISVIGIIVLIVKYKTNGLLGGIAYVGLTAIYAILVRYANVTISVESILGIIIVLILNYIFTTMLLKNINKLNKEEVENVVGKATTETYKTFFNRIAPICILSIVFCFIKWIPVSSFGMTTFWGLVIIAIYNAIATRILLKIKTESK